MTYLILGFLTGMSLILALGPQNIFVIEQGLKKEFIFLVCLICSISDFLLIFLGIFIFYYFENFFTPIVEFILNILLFILSLTICNLYCQNNKSSEDTNPENEGVCVSGNCNMGFGIMKWKDNSTYIGEFWNETHVMVSGTGTTMSETGPKRKRAWPSWPSGVKPVDYLP